MTKLYAKKFVKSFKQTKEIAIMSSAEIRNFVDIIFRKIPDITKEELASICKSPAKINNFLN